MNTKFYIYFYFLFLDQDLFKFEIPHPRCPQIEQKNHSWNNFKVVAIPLVNYEQSTLQFYF